MKGQTVLIFFTEGDSGVDLLAGKDSCIALEGEIVYDELPRIESLMSKLSVATTFLGAI